MRCTVRLMILLTLLTALNLAAVIATSKSYPRPRISLVIDHGNGHGGTHILEDGTAVAYRSKDFGPPTDLHVIRPPRPTLLRIWSPVIAGAAITLLALVVAWRRPELPKLSAWGRAGIAAASAVAVWLAVPLALIAGDTREDYHIHGACRGVAGGQSVHATLFWPRYWYLLRGRPFPDDYICPIPHEVSLSPPRW